MRSSTRVAGLLCGVVTFGVVVTGQLDTAHAQSASCGTFVGFKPGWVPYVAVPKCNMDCAGLLPHGAPMPAAGAFQYVDSSRAQCQATLPAFGTVCKRDTICGPGETRAQNGSTWECRGNRPGMTYCPPPLTITSCKYAYWPSDPPGGCEVEKPYGVVELRGDNVAFTQLSISSGFRIKTSVAETLGTTSCFAPNCVLVQIDVLAGAPGQGVITLTSPAGKTASQSFSVHVPKSKKGPQAPASRVCNCPAGQGCSLLDNTCRPLGTEGAACRAGGQCDSNLFCTQSGFCVPNKEGASCRVSRRCAGGFECKLRVNRSGPAVSSFYSSGVVPPGDQAECFRAGVVGQRCANSAFARCGESTGVTTFSCPNTTSMCAGCPDCYAGCHCDQASDTCVKDQCSR